MATWAIGDLQGCLDPLLSLLDQIDFNPQHDTLWFAGDLVNRGPQSLEALRFVRDLGDCAITVLGNHDIHLLAAHAGLRKPSRLDTLQPVLDAPDRDSLCDWLRQCPLFHHDKSLGYAMVHAGLHPHWTLAQAQSLANEVETALAANQWQQFLDAAYGNRTDKWSAQLSDEDRRAFTLNCMTRMRFLKQDLTLDFRETCAPAQASAELTPWFEHWWSQPMPARLVFGHWSTVGDTTLNSGTDSGTYGLDQGCVWGGCLAAMELTTRRWATVECVAAHDPVS